VPWVFVNGKFWLFLDFSFSFSLFWFVLLLNHVTNFAFLFRCSFHLSTYRYTYQYFGRNVLQAPWVFVNSKLWLLLDFLQFRFCSSFHSFMLLIRFLLIRYSFYILIHLSIHISILWQKRLAGALGLCER